MPTTNSWMPVAVSRPVAIAIEFGVSLATVRAQIRSILTKLQVGSRLAAVALVNEAGRS